MNVNASLLAVVAKMPRHGTIFLKETVKRNHLFLEATAGSRITGRCTCGNEPASFCVSGGAGLLTCFGGGALLLFGG